MRINTIRVPLLALATLALHGAVNLAIADTYVDEAQDFFPPVTAQLVAHFPLDGDGDSTLGGGRADLVRDVTFGGAGANTNTGTSASFNGDSGLIQHAFDARLNPGSFTVACWAKPNPSTLPSCPVASGFLLLIDPNASPPQWVFFSDNGPDPGTQSLSGQATLGVWQHIAVTYDDTIEQKKLYIDGILVGTANDSIVPNADSPFNIGAAAPSGLFDLPFDGEIDDIGLWNGALSLQKIQSVMNQGVLAAGDVVSWQGSSETVSGLRFGTNAFTSIQDAIDAVEDGGTVHIAQGSYYANGSLQSGDILINKNVTIRGAGAHVTEISGGGDHRVFRIFSGDVNLSALSIVGGSVTDRGGGISQGAGSNVVIEACVVANNSGAGGGGIASNGGSMTILNSTIHSNSAVPRFDDALGGGIYSRGSLFISNSTISGNTCDEGSLDRKGLGAGIFIADAPENVSIVNSTITGNTANRGGGIASVRQIGGVTVVNSIVAGNSATESDPDASGSVASGGGNLVGFDTTQNAGFANDLRLENTPVTIDQVIRTDLTFNGGPTPTHRLVPGSPAIDAGDNDASIDQNGDPLLTDQRGQPFLRRVCSVTDSGAVESDPSGCQTSAQNLLVQGTMYGDGPGGVPLDTLPIKFANVIDDDGDPFDEQDEPNFKPELVQEAIDIYKQLVNSYADSHPRIPGFDGDGVTVTSRGPGLMEDTAGGGNADFDRACNLSSVKCL